MQSAFGERLSELHDALENFRVTDCRIAHERVIFDGGVAVRRHENGVASSFVRAGLCHWQERELQLACAHTMARHRLTSVVLALAELGVLEEGESREFSERVVELANSVHAADWAKGELEAAYAVAVESGTTAEVVSLRTRRKALETGHAAACTELRDLLQQIRRAIAVTSA